MNDDIRTPMHPRDDTIAMIYEGGLDVEPRPVTNAETLLGNRPISRLAPLKPQGTPIYFADEIPLVWLLEKLAEAGLITTRWVSDGNLHSVLSVDARAEVARIVGELVEDARLRAVQSAEYEP